ncbi:hypothetical protein [Marinobacter sp.]|uniref:hypothetical protein n=1 Tax=Gammaproteobacteria TaxID=1236 RepID=UPI003A94C016
MNAKSISMFVAALFALTFFGTNALAQSFTIRSQNFLHLGWKPGTPFTTNKCTALSDMMGTADLIVVQELMIASDPCQTETATKGFTFQANINALGSTSYKEFYGFYVRNGANSQGTSLSYTGDTKSAAINPFVPPPPGATTFERPPFAVAIKAVNGPDTNYVWVGNIHSIFGKSVTQRYTEATGTATFFNTLKSTTILGTSNPTGWPVIIAGDWNIPVKNKAGNYTAGFTWLSTNSADGLPYSTATSLSNTGKPASPYDHFIYSTDTLALSNVTPVTASSTSSFSSLTNWRSRVSDHLGIQAGVSFN